MARKKKSQEEVTEQEAIVQEEVAVENEEASHSDSAAAEEVMVFGAVEESYTSADEADVEEVLEAPDEEFSEEALQALNIKAEEDEVTEPEFSEEEILAQEAQEDAPEVEVSGSELESFESAEIEDVQFIDDDQLVSIVESLLFATDRPVSFAAMKAVFKGTSVRSKQIRAALDTLASDYASARRGFTLEEVSSGYQLRTKSDNVTFLRQGVKARPFKLSGPALEVMSIVAYKQPMTKSEIDQIRGVESGHLLRALMEKGLVAFGEKSELPGKPMFYESTRKFLEIFGLRNIKELPSLHEIDQLIPEGIGDEKEKETLSDLTSGLSQEIGTTYSEGEDELMKITDQLEQITTTSDFFEQEKIRQKLERDKERARDIRDSIALGEEVATKDINWLEKFEESLRLAEQAAASGESEVAEVLEAAAAPEEESIEFAAADAEFIEEDVDGTAPEADEQIEASGDDSSEREPEQNA